VIYRFRLISNEVKDFIRDIEIRSDQSFYDFHLCLTKHLNYDNSQICSFYITNQEWEKNHEITLFDISDGENPEVFIMDKVSLEEMIKEPRQRLLYVFDFFNERAFFVELIKAEKVDENKKYPKIVFSQGHAPDQLLMDNMNFDDLLLDE